MAESTPTVQPAGPISVPVRRIVEALAVSSAFQQWTGTSGNGAYAHIHHPSVVEPLAKPWPMAVVQPNRTAWRAFDVSHLRPSGSVSLLLFAHSKYPAALDWDQTDFENNVGQVLSDLAQELSKATVALNIASIEPVQPAAYSEHPKRAGDPLRYWTTKYQITWGSS